MGKNQNLKTPLDTTIHPEGISKYKVQENWTVQQPCKCELYVCTPIIRYLWKSIRQEESKKGKGFNPSGTEERHAEGKNTNYSNEAVLQGSPKHSTQGKSSR